MSPETMSILMEEVFHKLVRLREAGQQEYARDSGNVFANFERVGAELGLSREKVLMVYFLEYVDGIAAWVNGHQSQREAVEGRLEDAMMYLLLLYGMVQQPKVHLKFTWNNTVKEAIRQVDT